MSQADEKDPGGSQAGKQAAESAEGKERLGMPNEKSVLSEKTFTSPKGKRYRILETDEMDEYEEAPVPPAPPKKRRGKRTNA